MLSVGAAGQCCHWCAAPFGLGPSLPHSHTLHNAQQLNTLPSLWTSQPKRIVSPNKTHNWGLGLKRQLMPTNVWLALEHWPKTDRGVQWWWWQCLSRGKESINKPEQPEGRKQ